jgi:hypothetical protein
MNRRRILSVIPSVGRFLKKTGRALPIVLLLAIAFIKTAGLTRLITDAPSKDDALANVVAAYNLAYHGVISASENAEENLAPTNYREPLPIFFLAAHIRLQPALSSAHTVQTMNKRKASGKLKRHNLFWAFLLLAGVGLTCLAAAGPLAIALPSALLAMHLTHIVFLKNGGMMDLLTTEIQAAALLVWIAFALLYAGRSKRLAWFAASGLLIGSLALTKGIFYYVGLAFVAIVFLVHFISPKQWSRRRVVLCFGSMLLAMGMVVLPWMARNWLKLGAFEITQRSGVVMMVRAHKELMSDLERQGAFWYYAPALLQEGKLALYPGLHFSGEDLREEGRLQRLNRSDDSDFAARDIAAEKAGRPEAALSFYRAGRAERVRLENHYRRLGAANPAHLADVAMRRKAMRVFSVDPWRHLKMSVLFLWRGMWCMEQGPLTAGVIFWLNGLSFLAMSGMAVCAFFRNRLELAGAALLPAGAMAFMALTTHFLPRYSSMLIPNMLMSLVLACAWGAVGLVRELRRFF